MKLTRPKSNFSMAGWVAHLPSIAVVVGSITAGPVEVREVYFW